MDIKITDVNNIIATVKIIFDDFNIIEENPIDDVRILMLKGEKGEKGDGGYDDTEVRRLITEGLATKAPADIIDTEDITSNATIDSVISNKGTLKVYKSGHHVMLNWYRFYIPSSIANNTDILSGLPIPVSDIYFRISNGSLNDTNFVLYAGNNEGILRFTSGSKDYGTILVNYLTNE